MKILGRSPAGGTIVELTDGEAVVPADPFAETPLRCQEVKQEHLDWFLDCLSLGEENMEAVFRLMRELTKVRATAAEFEQAMTALSIKIDIGGGRDE